MRLARLLAELETTGGSATEAHLARQLEASLPEVRAMLAALRAAGRLGPEGGDQLSDDSCDVAGSCTAACPGPSACPFIVDLGAPLELRGTGVRIGNGPAGRHP